MMSVILYNRCSYEYICIYTCMCNHPSKYTSPILALNLISCHPVVDTSLNSVWNNLFQVTLHTSSIFAWKCSMSHFYMFAFNTLRPRQNGRYLPDDIFECIFLKENVWIPIKISLKFVPKSPINNIPALAQIMAWGRPGDKPLSEPMLVRLPTHICVTRPQWVKAWVSYCLIVV